MKRKDNFKNKPEKQPINVFFFGMDSITRGDWLAKLPKSSEYLLNTLGSTVLNGYNIVGDGTSNFFTPFLTGKKVTELPEVNRAYKTSQYVDLVYPFIWNNFSNILNYATMFNEEWPNAGK